VHQPVAERSVMVEDVDSSSRLPEPCKEFVLHVDGDARRIQVPMALVAGDVDAVVAGTEELHR
jgi:hypothetical protein